MLESICDEIKKLQKIRIESYTEKTKITKENKKEDSFELEIQNNRFIRIKNKILDYDKIKVKGRTMTIFIYGEEGYLIKSVKIDLTNKYIQIYETEEPDIVEFVEVDLKSDQIGDPEDLDIRDYPKISFSVKESEDLPKYYEVIYTVRMNPVDSKDYIIKTYLPISNGIENMFEQILFNINKIKEMFKRFFRMKKIVFNDDFGAISKSTIYTIVDYHYTEYLFAIKDESDEESEILVVPFSAILNSILEYDEEKGELKNSEQ